MKKEAYAVTVAVHVHDPLELWKAARQHYRDENAPRAVEDHELDDYLGPESEPDVSACLREFIDPGSLAGSEIMDSSCEHEGTIGEDGRLSRVA